MKVKYGERYAIHYTRDASTAAGWMNIDMTSNYRATPVLTFAGRQAVLVRGKDVGRYTLDDYILPLLNKKYATSEVDRLTAQKTRAF